MPNRKQPDTLGENLFPSATLPLAIPHEEYEKEILKISADPQARLFPIGDSAAYIYEFHADNFIWIEETMRSITGLDSQQVLKMKGEQFFGFFISNEHILSSKSFTRIVLKFLQGKTDFNYQITVDLDFISKDREIKRVLIQFAPLYYDNNGALAATRGLITDISHLKKQGAPSLMIRENGKIVLTEKGDLEDEINLMTLDLTKKEIEILSLRGRGMQIKEIAHQLDLQKSTVFSYLRNIRRKSSMDIIPLIRLLSDKGIISGIIPIISHIM